MRYVKYLISALAVLIFFVIGCIMFAPWLTLAEYALAQARQQAAERGIYIVCDGLRETGSFMPVFEASGVEIESSFARVSIDDLTITVDLVGCIASFGPAVDIRFRGATVNAIPSLKFDISSGTFGASLKGSEADVRDVDIRGDMSVNGAMRYDMASRKILDSTITFAVPEEIENILASPLMSRFVEKDGSGGWKVRYEAQER